VASPLEDPLIYYRGAMRALEYDLTEPFPH
jgi:hypothetical protein